MKILILLGIILLNPSSHSGVLDLGSIGSESQLLDQRMVLEATEHQRFQSLGEYYKFQKNDLVQLMGGTDVTDIESRESINHRWDSLIEGAQ